MNRLASIRFGLTLVSIVAVLAVALLACGAEPGSSRSGVTIAPPPTATPADGGAAVPTSPDTSSDGQGADSATTVPPSPTGEGAAAPTPTGSFTPTPLNADDLDHLPEDPTELMYSALDSSIIGVGRKMAYTHNEAFIPVLMELMRFQRHEENILLIASYLVRIRDEIPRDDVSVVPQGQGNWGYWQEWLSQNPEVRAPEGYDRWKGILFGVIDPPMGAFMYEGVPTTIRLEEIVWGGVRRDGIPDLRFPEAISPEQATYLEPGDRVFGVSINGEHRAYPLRVLNPHEMANDILGGEQFALAY